MNITQALETVGTNVWNGTKAVGEAAGGAVSRWWENLPGNQERSERERNEATETKALRTLMQVYDPDGKDKYTAMGLGELRGSAQAIAVKQHMDQLAREEQQQQNAIEFQRLLSQPNGGSAASRMAAVMAGTGPTTGAAMAPAMVAQYMQDQQQPTMTPRRVLATATQAGYRLPPQMMTQLMQQGDDGAGWQLDPRQIQDLSNYGLPGQVFVPTSKGGGAIRSKFDPSQFMDVEGYTTVPGKDGPRYIKEAAPKTMPTSAQNSLTEMLQELHTAVTNANADDQTVKATATALTPEQYRTTAKKRADAIRASAKALIDLQHKLGAVDDKLRDSLYEDYGIGKASGNLATPTRKFNPKTGKIE